MYVCVFVWLCAAFARHTKHRNPITKCRLKALPQTHRNHCTTIISYVYRVRVIHLAHLTDYPEEKFRYSYFDMEIGRRIGCFLIIFF